MRLSRRRALEADLDRLHPPRGACAFCGGPDARHRLFDAWLGRYTAGDALESLALDYGVSREAVEVVIRLALRPSFPIRRAPLPLVEPTGRDRPNGIRSFGVGLAAAARREAEARYG